MNRNDEAGARDPAARTGARGDGLAPGLYLVAVPIGTARDITLRALDILRTADVIAAEDTRSMRKLLEIHGVDVGGRPIVSYHDHNGDRARPGLLKALAEGKSVAYASEAGMPMVADPGFDLARAAREAGHAVTAAPGASAALTALLLSGLPTERFFFGGFLPTTASKRSAALREVAGVPGSLIFYESPRRIAATLAAAAEALGGTREAAVCRELTKKFEEVRRGPLAELAEEYDGKTVKGEVVLVIGKGSSPNISEVDVESLLKEALKDGSVRDAADQVAAQTGLKRRDVYQRALALSRDMSR